MKCIKCGGEEFYKAYWEKEGCLSRMFQVQEETSALSEFYAKRG